MRIFVIVTAVLIVSVGCSGQDDGSTSPVDTSPLSAAELGWIRGFSNWTIEIHNEDLGPPVGARLVTVCRERLEAIGPAPTDRLRPAEERLADVCPFLEQRGTYRRGLETIFEADDLLLPFLRDEQQLAFDTGITEESRADPDFSGIASDVADYPLEVRCWSESEWRRVVEEDNAWTDSNDDPETLVSWADDSDDRIHMQLEQCNLLVRVQSADVGSSWSRSEQIDAADSLGTFAHEVQHFVLPDADEATVECAAVRSLERVALRLGIDQASGALLAETYRTEIYPEQPEEYIAESCGK